MQRHLSTRSFVAIQSTTRHHFQVYVVNEYRTSKTCPHCANDLETIHRREGESFIVHAVLQCQSEDCQLPMNKNRLWNRDDVATLNIRAIVRETVK